jgi:hypothetical protein
MKGGSMHEVSVGIDQSYKRTGISISIDGSLKQVSSVDLSKLKSKSAKRAMLRIKLDRLLSILSEKYSKVNVTVERIRLRSDGFLNINYIESIGALNAVIVDVCDSYDIEVYSVDTRCWKAKVVGTSKPMQNKYGVDPKKWPTMKWCINEGFRKSLTHEVVGRRMKGTFTASNGRKYELDDDAADSAAISMYRFSSAELKLQVEN